MAMSNCPHSLPIRLATLLVLWPAAWSAAPAGADDDLIPSFCVPGDGTTEVRWDEELLITNRLVTGDQRANPGGPWHFGSVAAGLLTNSGGGEEEGAVSQLLDGWLVSLSSEQRLLVRSDLPMGPDNPERLLPARPEVERRVLGPWRLASGTAAGATGVDAALAPLRLVAIVYRPDLADPAACRHDAGEVRFVYAVLDAPTADPVGAGPFDVLSFTVIVEYELPTTVRDAHDWAQAFRALHDHRCTTAADCGAYLDTLASLLAEGTRGGGARASIRTNEILAFPGEMRAFRLEEKANEARLALIPLAKTADLPFTGSAALSRWATDEESAILTGAFAVPAPLAALNAPTLLHTKWTLANSLDWPTQRLESLRVAVAVASCNGCHSLERAAAPNVDGVYHVAPDGELSRLVRDQDMPRRIGAYCELLHSTCGSVTPLEASRALFSRQVH